jgi:hypothetical protein
MPCYKEMIIVHERKAAEILAVKVATLRKWRWQGCGPTFIKVGAAVRYKLADLEKFIEAGSRSSTSDQPRENAA